MHHFANIFYPYIQPRRFINNRFVRGVHERELLALAFGIAILSFFGNLTDLILSWYSLISEEEFVRLLSSYFAVALFFVPIFLYLISGFFHVLLLMLYKIKKMSLSRLTFFWALFLCMPLQIILTASTSFFNHDYASNLLNIAMLLYFLSLWSIFNSEIFKVDKIIQIFMLKCSVFMVCFALVLLL